MNNLRQQLQTFENIKSLCTNFKKDSPARKTINYLNIRLKSLEEQWQDFNTRHTILLREVVETTEISYFTEDIYGKTKLLYESTRTEMQELLEKLQQDYKAIKFDLSGLNTEETSEKLDELLLKQQCNFKAIDRVMSKISLETLTEKWELEDQMSILKSKWEAIDKVHWELEAHLKGSNETYNNMFLEIEDNYDTLRKKINSKIWSSSHYEKTTPRIEIPEFFGNYSNWSSFKDLFLETVHNNPMINKAQKMQILKTKLKGEAERLIKHLTVTADNYQSCWKILVQRYDNRRLQFTSLFNIMLDLPTIQEPNAFSLKQMHDVIQESLNGLTNMGVDTNAASPFIGHLMSLKLDPSTFDEFTKEIHDPREVPNISELLLFLENKFMAYEVRNGSKKNNFGEKKTLTHQTKPNNFPLFRKPNHQQPKKLFHQTYYTANTQCPSCNGSHVLMQCPSFLQMNIAQRNNLVTQLHVCKNCLFSHGKYKCTSNKTCKECGMNHHTLLHYFKAINSHAHNSNEQQTHSTSTGGQTPSSNHLSNDEMEILLTTVQLNVKAVDGTYVTLRALLDQGSQVNLVSEDAAQLLRLPRQKINASISGIGSVSGDCKERLLLTCKSIYSNYKFETEALILKKITNNLPNSTFEKQNWPHLENLKLADPEYNVSRSVDLLLGADVYSEILMGGVLKGEQQSPIAQQTHLGWTLCGKLKTFNCHATLINLNEITKRETEELTGTGDDTPTNDQCDIDLGHMKPALPVPDTTNKCFLPHHDVLKKHSTSTKDKNLQENEESKDGASRDLHPSKLINHDLWWNGPNVLKTERSEMPEKSSSCVYTTTLSQQNTSQTQDVTTITTDKHFITDLQTRHSSLDHIAHVTAWVTSFNTALKTKVKCNTDYLTANEYKQLYEKGTTGGRLNNSHLPPGKWTLERVLELQPGTDGHVRVPAIKTKSGTMKAGRMKLSPLSVITEKETTDQKPEIRQEKRTVKNTPGKKIIPNSKLKLVILCLFATLMLLSGAHSTDVTSKVHITSFEPRRPVYYDTIGKIKTVHDEWTLLMFYNLTNYWNGIERATTYLDQMNSLCEMTDPRYCRVTLSQLRHEMIMLGHYNSLLLTPQRHMGLRKRRGLVNGIGYIANELFGVLDQRFAEKYQEDIKSIQNNENHLLALIKNQTSIVELENEILRKNEDNIRQQVDTLNNFMNQTDISFAKIENELEIVMASSYFSSTSLSAYLLINNLRKVQEMLFNSLTNLYKGHIDVQLLSPSVLIDQLNVIAGQLPRTLSLPVDNVRENIKDFYDLLYVKARVTSTYFLLEVHIPLITDEDFIIYRVLPIPVATEQGTKIIGITTRYIAVDLKENTYIPLTQEDMQLCVKQRTDRYICNKNLPIYKLHTDNAPCEAKLLDHFATTTCSMQNVTCKDAWIELHASNSWLAICCDTCNLRAICDDDVSTHVMTSSSIVTLEQGCVLQTRESTIYSHNNYNSQMKVGFEFDLPPSINNSINKIINVTHHQLSPVVISSQLEAKVVDKRIAFQKEQENAILTPISSHDVHQYIVMYSILAIIILVAVTWMVKRWRSKRDEHQNAPKAEAQTPVEYIELQTMRTASHPPRPSREEPPPKSARAVAAAVENINFNFDDIS